MIPPLVLNQDCFEFMAGLEDKAFDVVVTSPPYNMNLRVNGKGTGYVSRQIVKEISTKYVAFSDNLPMTDYEAFFSRLIVETTRIAEIVFLNVQIVTGNKPAVFAAIGQHAHLVKDLIVWDKVNAQPAMRDGCLNSQFELLFVLGGDPIKRRFENAQFERGKLSNCWRIKRERAPKGHGAIFPRELVRTILDNFTEEGASVFDPFCGTGTTGVVCGELGRSFVGTEIDAAYCALAKSKILNV